MTAPARFSSILALYGLLAGCTERRLVITSDPIDALVILNDVEAGRTPCEVDFTYYGTYDVRLKKEGFEPLITEAKAEAPFYEWPGIDLIALAIPARKSTIIHWHFTLEPESTDRDALLRRAGELRGALADPEPPAGVPDQGAPPGP